MRWTLDVKAKARKMRLEGSTYSEITRECGVVKSTLCEWFKGLPYPNHPYFTNRKEWMAEIRKLSLGVRRKNREKRLVELKEEMKMKVEELDYVGIGHKRAILSMLYWAEGCKEGIVQFVNVDPRLMLLFLTLLRECYEIDESKLRVRLHLHYYHRAGKVINFWSELLNIPKNKFGKIYWKKRSKEKVFRRNEGGICTLRYNSVNLRRRMLLFAYAFGNKLAPVAQWIERVPAKDEMQVQFLPGAPV